MYGRIITFLAGALVGSFITAIYIDVKKEKAEQKATDKKDTDKTDDNASTDKYHENSTIDDYKPISQEEMTEYNSIVDDYVDPAESESPREDDLDELHESTRNRVPTIISRTEFGTYGFEVCDLNYNPENGEVWEDGEEPYHLDDVYLMLGNLLEDSGFGNDDAQHEMYVRNFSIQTDYKIVKNPGYI